jgi:two-component system cell cycle response regulator
MSENTESKKRLLIVDDSKVIRVTARKILRDHFETIEAVDGENAWEVLTNEGPFSLVVSDLTMPNLDGFGLLERIRSSRHPDIQDIPVIIITGANDSEATKARASQAGATDFIGKPFDSVHLLARTQAHASAHAVTHALQQETFSLEEKVTTDPLSGLPNEISFMERGYQQLSYAIRHKTALSIFLVEIDNYPELVRQYGKAINEPVIRSVAGTLHAEARQEDMVARTGTARFGLLLPGMNMAGIHNFSERLNRSISTSPVKQGEDRINLTVSIGVSAPDIRRDTRLDDLLAEAARHLSLARSQGGNQAVFSAAEGDTIEVCAPEYADEIALLEEAVMGSAADACAKGAAAGVSLEPEPQELPTIECREMPDNEPLPGRFAGPVPDSMGTARAGTLAGNSMDNRSPFNGMTIQEQAVPQGKAVFTIDESDAGFEETIVITAPFDIYSTKSRESTSSADGKQRSGAAENAAPAKTASQPDAPGNAAAETVKSDQAEADMPEDEAAGTDTTQRNGFFRRLLSAFRSPFGRRRQA